MTELAILPETKPCSTCGVDKPLDDYYKDKRQRLGRQSECKLCHTDRTGEVARNLPTEVRLYRGAKYRASQGGYPFTITVDDIVIPARCPILGIELVAGEGQATANSPTLDKINPLLGYVPGNVQVVSYKANSMKRDASAQELLRFARWVIENVDGV